jgi:prepilin-type N-terminal cleavage/methylation domain-containing protein
MSGINQRGFTLIEILIAITLLAFITLGVVNITQNAMDTKDRTSEINKNNLQIETAMSRFDWDFSQIYSPMYFSTAMNINQNAGMDYTGLGNTGNIPNNTIAPTTQVNPQLQAYYEQLMVRFQTNEHFSGLSKDGIQIPRFYNPEKNVLEFFTTSNRRKTENTKQSHFAWVRYSLADQVADPDLENITSVPKGLKSFVRHFTADDPYSDKRINPDSDERIKAAVLLPNVESLEFQFWDPARKVWETTLRAVQGGESAIRGVKILLTWYDSTGVKREASRTFRPHWPQVIIQDPATPAAGTATGATPATGAATDEGDEDE